MSSEQVFSNLHETADHVEEKITEIENSYCVNCGEDGTTRMLLTEIPFFRQVVIVSFHCPHCHFENKELQPAQQISERGVRYELSVGTARDLSRQVVKTEWAQVMIPEVDFEVKQQNGLVTSVEGLIDRSLTGLQYALDNSEASEEGKRPLKEFIGKMTNLKEGKENFTLIIDDISGNSFVENLCAPQPDPQLKISNFIRTIEDDKLLGIYTAEVVADDANDNLKNEVLQFPTNCPSCNAPCFTNMKVTNIPHFKELVIMATNCDVCGHRTNEIKSGAGIEPKGVRIELKIKDGEDLKREVIRSDTCNISIPELNLSLNSTGSGRYTTIQGLGLNMIEDLQRTNPFIDGDSSREEIRSKIGKLNEQLQNLIGFTIILDDPCGNSFVEGVANVERYERSNEQNEELGLNDMNTVNYGSAMAKIPEETET